MPLPPKHQQLMNGLHLELVTDLNIKDILLDALVSIGLITDQQKQRLSIPHIPEVTRKGELLQDLRQKDENMLQKFVQALKNSDQPDIAARIEKKARELEIPEDQYTMPGIEAAPDPPSDLPGNDPPSYTGGFGRKKESAKEDATRGGSMLCPHHDVTDANPQPQEIDQGSKEDSDPHESKKSSSKATPQRGTDIEEYLLSNWEHLVYKFMLQDMHPVLTPDERLAVSKKDFRKIDQLLDLWLSNDEKAQQLYQTLQKTGQENWQNLLEENVRPHYKKKTVKVIYSNKDDCSHVEDEKCYSMKDPRGKVLIINVIKVKNACMLFGGNIDRDRLKSLWEQLGFELQVKNQQDGLSAEKIKKYLKNFADDDYHRNASCAIVCVLSHGDAEGIFGSDGEIVTYDEIQEQFNNENCPNLHEKPKFFIFDACRGVNKDEGIKVTAQYPKAGASSEDELRMSGLKDRYPFVKLIPKYTDIIIAYPTHPGFVSWADDTTGSAFTQTLVDVFAANAHDSDVCAMLNKVNGVLSTKKQYNKKYYVQASMFTSSLQKQYFYFFPEQ